jgi:CubicO group peptidase (beta-lactamase class C family)
MFAAASMALLVTPRCGFAQWVILHGKNGHVERNIPAEMARTLKDLAKKGAQFRSIAFSPNGGWIILHDRNAIFARNAPTEPVKILAELQEKDVELKSIAFAFAGGWTAFHGKGSESINIGQPAFDRLGELFKDGHKPKTIAFSPEGGWLIFFDKNGYWGEGIPKPAYDKVVELAKKNVELKSAAFARNGGWAIIYNKNSVASENVPKDAEKALQDLAKKGAPIHSISFMTSSFVPLSQNDAETRDEVLFRMNRSDVPGLGVALIESGKLAWVRGYGVLRAKEDSPVTEQTRFQAGALSQPLTAVAALRLVQQKKLALDQPLNEKLVSWKVPENEFTKNKPPTLRHVLSHSAGFNVPILTFNDESTSTLRDILEGKADTPAVGVEIEPGSKTQTSAGGYCVAEQLLTEVTGKPFPDLMLELVLGPLKMSDSTFQQPLPREWETAAAVGHFVGPQPLAWRWSNCSSALAAAGLWSTPADLARCVVALCEAHQGKPKAILAAAEAKAMLTRQVDDMGLGFNLKGTGNSLAFMLRGTNPGYLCYLIAYPAAGQGAVLMCNSDAGDRLINEIVENLRIEYGWPE